MENPEPLTIDPNTVEINGTEYLYSITKLNEPKGISIKLESIFNKDVYFLYNASEEQIKENIRILYLCRDINHMIETLKDAFDQKRVKIEQTNKMILEFNKYLNNEQKFEIKLEKHEPLNPLNDLNEKIKNLDKKCSELMKEIEELKKNKDKNNDDDFNEKQIKNIKNKINLENDMKEIFDKEIKEQLYKEFEEKIMNNLENSMEEIINKELSKKFKIIQEAKTQLEKDNKVIIEKINRISKLDTNNQKLEDLIKQKIDETKNKTKIDLNEIISNNNFIEKIQMKLIPFFDNIANNQSSKTLEKGEYRVNSNIIENFIILKINIDNKGEEIFLKQCNIYKYFKNFEPEDIEIIINDEKVPIKWKISKGALSNIKSNNCEGADKVLNSLKECYNFYWNFLNEGIYTIKIIFKKKLYSCEKMFNNCNNIIEIDLSSFDCSQVTNCEDMFNNCVSLKKVDFGKMIFCCLLISDSCFLIAKI